MGAKAEEVFNTIEPSIQAMEISERRKLFNLILGAVEETEKRLARLHRQFDLKGKFLPATPKKNKNARPKPSANN